VAIVLLVCLAVFFRDALRSGLHILYGDAYDGVIEVAILEHWHCVVTAGAPWDVTGYFHPYPGTLGYNDTDLIPGIPYTIARLAGADPFVAAFASHVAMKALGFAGMYVLLRRGLSVRTPLALAGAALFATANVSLLHMYHAQLLSVGLLPWLGVLTIRTVEAIRGERPRAILAYGCGFALLYGATAFSAFYALWFFTLFLAICAPVALLLAGTGERRAFLVATVRQWRVLLPCAFVAALALVPTLALYLPKLGADTQHRWDTSAYLYLPSATTLFDVGPGNLVWGRLPAALGYALPLPGGEVSVGLPIGMIAAALFAVLWGVRDRRRGRIVLAIGIAIAIMIAMAMRWPGDHSAWWYVHAYVPGASASHVRRHLRRLRPPRRLSPARRSRRDRPRMGWRRRQWRGPLLPAQRRRDAAGELLRTADDQRLFLRQSARLGSGEPRRARLPAAGPRLCRPAPHRPALRAGHAATAALVRGQSMRRGAGSPR
jgi:hypothetical protein